MRRQAETGQLVGTLPSSLIQTTPEWQVGEEAQLAHSLRYLPVLPVLVYLLPDFHKCTVHIVLQLPGTNSQYVY